LAFFLVKSPGCGADPAHDAGETDDQGDGGKDQEESGGSWDDTLEDGSRQRALNRLLYSGK